MCYDATERMVLMFVFFKLLPTTETYTSVHPLALHADLPSLSGHEVRGHPVARGPQLGGRVVDAPANIRGLGGDRQQLAVQPREHPAAGDVVDSLHGAGAAVEGDQEAPYRAEGTGRDQNRPLARPHDAFQDRKSTRLNSSH